MLWRLHSLGWGSWKRGWLLGRFGGVSDYVPHHSRAPGPQEQGSAVGGVGSTGGALGGLEGLCGGPAMSPHTGVPSIQELLEGLGAG